MTSPMTKPHIVLAGTVIIIWAANFIVVRWGLDRMSPLSLCTWRFVLTFFPACLFLPPPRQGWVTLCIFGALTGVGQFGLLSIAMNGHITAGLASVLIQTQAFFSIFLAWLVLHERVSGHQVAGGLVGALGIALIAFNDGAGATGIGVTLVLLAALSWAMSNVLFKHSGFDGDLLAFMTWSSPFAVLPLAGLSLATEGPAPLLAPFQTPSLGVWVIIFWQAYPTSLFGYAVWNSLMRTYSLARIGPLTLLVPVVALALAGVLLGEDLPLQNAIGAALVIVGVSAPYYPRLVGRRSDQLS